MKRIKTRLMEKRIFLFSLLTTIAFCLPSESTVFAGAEVTNVEAIKIAKNTPEVKAIGYNLDQTGITVTKYITPWNPYTPSKIQIAYELYAANTYLEDLNSELKDLKDKDLIKEIKGKIKYAESSIKSLENTREMRKNFKHKTYWAVHFYILPSEPKGGVLDGSFTVFIDSVKGKVLFPIHH